METCGSKFESHIQKGRIPERRHSNSPKPHEKHKTATHAILILPIFKEAPPT